jgi:hypothetical protein
VTGVQTCALPISENYTRHKLRFDPVINSYTAKSQGNFDPMEQTIGLFKVIFSPETGDGKVDPIVQQYKWIAALFQFSIIFGTLFLLDLIAILSKVMSRPGPYDVMVEFPELVATRNLEALRNLYPSQGENWDFLQGDDQTSTDMRVDLRNSEEVANLLLTAHLPRKQNSNNSGPSMQ